MLACLPNSVAEQLRPETIAAFDHYVQLSEQRMANNLREGPFLQVYGLAGGEPELRRIRAGEIIVEQLHTDDHGQPIPVLNGLIHHWRGTVFVPGGTLQQTLAFLEDYDNQYKYYSPDVERSKLVQRKGNDFKVYLRLRKHKVITVVLNTEYDVRYTLIGSDRATSASYSTRIAEVKNPGKPDESEMPVANDGGYLWRLNSYWRFLERDGGTYIQLEAISLTRGIPAGLNWLIGPFVTSIPRESMESTLLHTRDGLRHANADR